MKFINASFLGLLLLLLFISVSCTSNSQHTKMIDIQGHRGMRGLLPENSLTGFEKAIYLGVHTLEMDVVISKDHKVVVSHEPFMNHEIALDIQGNPIEQADEKKYNLYQMPYDSIRLYDCGSKRHPRFPNQANFKVSKPLLSEVFTLGKTTAGGKVRYNIEIKSKPSHDGIYTPEVSEFVRLVLEVITKHEVKQLVNLQSFDLRTLEEIKKQAPNMPVALLVDENERIDEKLQQLSYNPEIISPYYKLLTKENIKMYQEKGFLLVPWTVNDGSEMEQLIKWNIDGIITDYPNILTKLVHK